jgi:hypothetical protein
MYGTVDEIKSKSCFLSSSEMLLRRKYLSAMTTLNNTAEETEGNQGLLACPIPHVNIFSGIHTISSKISEVLRIHHDFCWKTRPLWLVKHHSVIPTQLGIPIERHGFLRFQ